MLNFPVLVGVSQIDITTIILKDWSSIPHQIMSQCLVEFDGILGKLRLR